MDFNNLKLNYGIDVRSELMELIENVESSLGRQIKIRSINKYPHLEERVKEIGGDLSQMPAEYIGKENEHIIFLARGLATEAMLAHEVLHADLYSKGYKGWHPFKCIGFSKQMDKELSPFLMGQLANLLWHELMYPIFTKSLKFTGDSFSLPPDEKFIKYFRNVLKKSVKNPYLNLYRRAELKINYIADTRPYINGDKNLSINLAKEFYPGLENEMPGFLNKFESCDLSSPVKFISELVILLNELGIISGVVS